MSNEKEKLMHTKKDLEAQVRAVEVRMRENSNWNELGHAFLDLVKKHEALRTEAESLAKKYERCISDTGKADECEQAKCESDNSGSAPRTELTQEMIVDEDGSIMGEGNLVAMTCESKDEEGEQANDDASWEYAARRPVYLRCGETKCTFHRLGGLCEYDCPAISLLVPDDDPVHNDFICRSQQLKTDEETG